MDRRSFIRNYLLANAYEAAIAVACIATAVTYFVAPQALESASVSHQVTLLAFGWTVMYGAAGLLILAGMLTASLRRELAGLSLLSGAIAINVTALIAVRGVNGASSALTFAALLAASLARARLIYKLLHRVQSAASGGDSE